MLFGSQNDYPGTHQGLVILSATAQELQRDGTCMPARLCHQRNDIPHSHPGLPGGAMLLPPLLRTRSVSC
jgi:hypothetical protein